EGVTAISRGLSPPEADDTPGPAPDCFRPRQGSHHPAPAFCGMLPQPAGSFRLHIMMPFRGSSAPGRTYSRLIDATPSQPNCRIVVRVNTHPWRPIVYRIWFERPLPAEYAPLLDGAAIAIGAAQGPKERALESLPSAHAIVASARVRYDGALMDKAPEL